VILDVVVCLLLVHTTTRWLCACLKLKLIYIFNPDVVVEVEIINLIFFFFLMVLRPTVTRECN
jgi:hypothetical protein